MNPFRHNKVLNSGVMAGLAVLLFGDAMFAAPLRVATWDLQPAATSPALSESNLMAQAADTLRKLNPDVILLQDVGNWKSCDALAKLLKPENYTVAVCSSFRDAQSGRLSRGQVAILSKTKAFLSWSDSSQSNSQMPAPPGGYVFAAVRAGKKSIGFFALQPAAEAAPQLMQQIKSVNQWTANRLWAQVVAGEFNRGQGMISKDLEQFGFVSAFTSSGSEKQSGSQPACIYIFEGSDSTHSQVAENPLFQHAATMTELDLNGVKPTVAKAPLALPSKPSETDPLHSVPEPAARPARSIYIFIASGTLAFGGLIFVAVMLQYKARERRAILRAQPSTPGKILIVPQSDNPPYVRIEAEGVSKLPTEGQPWFIPPDSAREGLMRHIAAWLKTRFVRRLVNDRAQLMETQQAAALKVMAVDKRLSNLEQQIRERNRSYEQRIDALLVELEVAREENRELIRERIATLRAEMEEQGKA